MKRFYLTAAAFTALSSCAIAADLTWTGPDPGTWDVGTTANWDNAGATTWTNGDNAIFNAGTYQVDLTSTGVTVGNLTYAGGGNLELRGSSLTGSLGDAITVNTGGATWDTGGGELEFYNIGNNNNTRLVMSSGDTLTLIGGGTFFTGENPQNNANGTWGVGGATLDVTAATVLRGDTTTVGQFGTVKLADGSSFFHQRNADRRTGSGNPYLNNWELTSGTVVFDNRFARNYQLGGVVSGTGGMKVQFMGNRELRLWGDNTFSGGLEVSTASRVVVQEAADLGASTNDITLSGGGILKVEGVTLGSDRDIILSGTGGSFINAGVNSFGGKITGSGNLQIGNSVYSGNVNTLTLTGTSSDYTGETKIERGKIALGNNDVLSSATVLNIGGGGNTSELQMKGFNTTIAGLYTTGTNTKQIRNDGGSVSTLTIDVATGETYIYGGNLVGADFVNIVKTGDGSQTFTRTGGFTATFGDITANGGTLIWSVGSSGQIGGAISVGAAGVLQVGGGSTIGTIGDLDVANAGTLIFNRSDAETYGGVISGTGAIQIGGGGTITLTGDNSGATGPVTVSAGSTLAGIGTIGGATTINGTHSPGTSPGIQTFTAGINYSATSTLDIDVSTNSSDTLLRGVSPLGYAGVDVTAGALSVDPAATATVALDSVTGDVDLDNVFWDTAQSWLVVDVQGAATASDANVPTLAGVTLDGSTISTFPHGTFSLSRAAGSTAENSVYLNWTPSVVSTWTGDTNGFWTTGTNWTVAPGTDDAVLFNSVSDMNLATTLGADYDLSGLQVIDPTGPVSIGGANNLTLGSGGIDLSSATQDLSITSPVILSSEQSWDVASGLTLSVSGAVTGSGNLTLSDAGTVSLGAANILPNGASAGNLTVASTLDLNGNSQSVNALTGGGIVDNSAGGSATLTVDYGANATFGGTLQNTGGDLALVKTGGSLLTLTGANTFSGGYTNNAGNVRANNDAAFGTGPVVANAGQIYPTTTTVFSNTLTLNNSKLRIGGGGGKTITWNGPVTATGTTPGLSADGGTGGVTLGSTLDITGATFTSFANAATNKINGVISGAGGNLNVTNGTLQLSGANVYTGDTTLSGSAALQLMATGTITGDVIINGGGNFNVRNTVGWVYSGIISGDDTGSINVNNGTDAELAGPISGLLVINAGGNTTDTTISGDISGISDVNVQSNGSLTPTLHLSGDNSYTGTTFVGNNGTLILESSNALPDTSNVIMANGILDATVIGTDSAGTFDVNAAATINLGTGAELAFADSSAEDWAAGSLDITGDFVSGVSLRFGTTDAGLTDPQLALITATGFSDFDLDSDGYLTATGSAYAAWASLNGLTEGVNDAEDDDPEFDGIANALEYILGGDPLVSDTSILPVGSVSGGNFVLTFTRSDESEEDAIASVEFGSDLTSFPSTTAVVPAASGFVSGVSFVIDENGSGDDLVTASIVLFGGTEYFGRVSGSL